MTHKKKCPHLVHFNVPRDWFEANSRHQKRYSKGGKKNRGRGLLGRVTACYLFFSSRAGGIQQTLQSDWFLEQVEFSHMDRYSGRNPSSRSIFVNELAVIVNLSPFFRSHRRLINASLSLFTFRWQGKLL